MSVWESKTLGDLERESDGTIQTGPFGSQLHMSDYSDVGTPVVMPTNIRDLRVDPTGIARVGGEHVERLARHKLRAGDIVYSRRGDVEKCALITENEEGWLCGTGCLLVRVQGPNLDARFLSYLLSRPETRAWISQHAVGATMPNLNTEILREVPVDVPDVKTQCAIAATLGALDDKIGSNRRAVEVLQHTAAALFTRWRSDAVPGVASTFGAYADVYGGATPKTTVPDFWGGGLAWTTPTDVTGLSAPYLFETSRTITDEGLRSCTAVMHPAGTIFMTSRATIGAFAINQVPAATNQGFIAVRPRQEADRYFLFEEMRSRVDEFLDNANGSTFLEISRGRFKELPLEVPEPEAIALLDEQVGPLHRKAAQLALESDRLTALRNALLPELLSGRVRALTEARP